MTDTITNKQTNKQTRCPPPHTHCVSAPLPPSIALAPLSGTHHRHRFVNAGEVLDEPIQDTPRRLHVEEGHRRPQDPPQQPPMHVPRRRYGPERDENRRRCLYSARDRTQSSIPARQPMTIGGKITRHRGRDNTTTYQEQTSVEDRKGNRREETREDTTCVSAATKRIPVVPLKKPCTMCSIRHTGETVVRTRRHRSGWCLL